MKRFRLAVMALLGAPKISRSFLQTGAIVMLGNGLTAVIGMAALRLYTELAPAHVFGAANLVLGALALGSQIFIQPVLATQIRYHTGAKLTDDRDRFTAEALRWALVAAAVFAGVALFVFFVWRFTGSVHLTFLMLLAAIGWIFASATRSVFMNRLHAEQRMKSYIALRVGEAALIVLFTGISLALAPRPEAFLWGQAIALASAVMAVAVFAPWPTWRLLTVSTTSDFVAKAWSYGAAFVPMALLFWLANLADRYVLAGLVSTAAVGQYLAAFVIASSGFGLTNGAMGDLFRPKLFDAENKHEHHRATRVFIAWLLTYIAISLCGLAVIALFGDWIVGLVLAEAYRSGATRIMLWIAFGYAINGLTTAVENRLFSLGRPVKVLWPLAAGAVANVAFSFLLIPRHGVTGAAQASCFSFALQFLLTTFVLRRALRERHRLATAGVSSSSGIGIGGTV